MDEEEKPLKIREAADRLGLDYATVRGAIEAGTLKAHPFEGSFRVRPADLADFHSRTQPRSPKERRRLPSPEPVPESPEMEAARLFAERAKRWAKRSGTGQGNRPTE